MDEKESIGVPITEREARRIATNKIIRRLDEWIGRNASVKICGGPHVGELFLAIVEPRMESGKWRTFNFTLVNGDNEVHVNCRIHTIEGIDRSPDHDKEVELVCVLDKAHVYLLHGTYNFYSRKGWVGILRNPE